ncbi:MAG: cytochrome b/b6 domain-containing protein [Candidatus Lambdaproteobacteria bacterium]|nr:cytochrome b/b6 domain-containing protein [Candidatus Lambdaproteobacteria bacterium]
MDAADGALRLARLVGVPAALLLCMFTGLGLAGWFWEPFGRAYVASRVLHLLSGYALALALLYELGLAVLTRGGRWVARRRGRPWRQGPARQTAPGLARPRVLGWAYWLLLALLVVSGLAVWVFDRYQLQVLPMLTPLRWRAVHQVSTTWFYATFVAVYARHAIDLMARVRAYLVSP